MRFKVLGVSFHISVPFCVMLAFMLIVDQSGLMTASILAMLVHEFGHLLMMRFCKCLPREVSFGFCGITIIGTSFCTVRESFLIALFGPFSNFMIFALCFVSGILLKDDVMAAFGVVQLLEGAVNLFPVKGLDGGTLLGVAIKHSRIRYKRFIFNSVSVLTSAVIFVGGMAVAVKNVSNPSLLLLGIYLIILNVCRREQPY